MADKRMFSKTIIDSDAYLDMPLSAQALYFHLSMRADDEGFINNPKKIQRMIGASEDDLKLLIVKSFIIPFDSGIVVIKHWRVHNYIQADRFHPSIYTDEKSQLITDKNKIYDRAYPECIQNVSNLDTECIQDVSEMDTQIRLDKIRIDKIRIDNARAKKTKHKYGEYKHIMLTDDELNKLYKEFGEDATKRAIAKVDEYCEQTGKTYKNYNLVIRKWGFDTGGNRYGTTFNAHEQRAGENIVDDFNLNDKTDIDINKLHERMGKE